MRRSAILRVAGLLLLASGAWAATGGPYDLRSTASLAVSWLSVDGGGATLLSGGAYTPGGTSGQADAGVLAGGDYTLGGGSWAGGGVAQHRRPTTTSTCRC